MVIPKNVMPIQTIDRRLYTTLIMHTILIFHVLFPGLLSSFLNVIHIIAGKSEMFGFSWMYFGTFIRPSSTDMLAMVSYWSFTTTVEVPWQTFSFSCLHFRRLAFVVLWMILIHHWHHLHWKRTLSIKRNYIKYIKV